MIFRLRDNLKCKVQRVRRNILTGLFLMQTRHPCSGQELLDVNVESFHIEAFKVESRFYLTYLKVVCISKVSKHKSKTGRNRGVKI